MHPAGVRRIRTLDVRPLIARGREPFTKIMIAINALAVGDSLIVVTPFLPSPLIEKLQGEGFVARIERQLDGSWQTQFTREASDVEPKASGGGAQERGIPDCARKRVRRSG